MLNKPNMYCPLTLYGFSVLCHINWVKLVGYKINLLLIFTITCSVATFIGKLSKEAPFVCQCQLLMTDPGSKVIKVVFMLNSTEYEISTAHKSKIPTNEEVSCFKSLRCCIYHANKC